MHLKRASIRDYSLPNVGKEQGRYIKDPETLKLAREMEHKYIGDASAHTPEAIQGLQERIKGLSALSLLLVGKGNSDTQAVADEYMGQIIQDADKGTRRFIDNAHKSLYGETPEIRGNAKMEGFGQLPFSTESLAGKIGLAGITAFHGSPHKFDKFKMDKIGTGEGAQAYGHGLYFAENPEVAKQYADSLGNTFVGKQKAPSFNKISEGPEEAAAFYARKSQFMPNNRAQGWDDAIAQAKQWSDDAKVVDVLKRWKAEDASVTVQSNLYKVDISDDAAKNFLDWDKPLSQQPEAMKALKSLAPMLDKDSAKLMAQDANKMTGAGLITYARKATGSDDAASEYLRKLGIPGIRYLDQGSREAGKGSSNFVVFDEDIVKVLERK